MADVFSVCHRITKNISFTFDVRLMSFLLFLLSARLFLSVSFNFFLSLEKRSLNLEVYIAQVRASTKYISLWVIVCLWAGFVELMCRLWLIGRRWRWWQRPISMNSTHSITYLTFFIFVTFEHTHTHTPHALCAYMQTHASKRFNLISCSAISLFRSNPTGDIVKWQMVNPYFFCFVVVVVETVTTPPEMVCTVYRVRSESVRDVRAYAASN